MPLSSLSPLLPFHTPFVLALQHAEGLGVTDVGEIGIVQIPRYRFRQLALEGLELLGAALIGLVEALHLAGVVVAEEIVCICCKQSEPTSAGGIAFYYVIMHTYM